MKELLWYAVVLDTAIKKRLWQTIMQRLPWMALTTQIRNIYHHVPAHRNNVSYSFRISSLAVLPATVISRIRSEKQCLLRSLLLKAIYVKPPYRYMQSAAGNTVELQNDAASARAGKLLKTKWQLKQFIRFVPQAPLLACQAFLSKGCCVSSEAWLRTEEYMLPF